MLPTYNNQCLIQSATHTKTIQKAGSRQVEGEFSRLDLGFNLKGRCKINEMPPTFSRGNVGQRTHRDAFHCVIVVSKGCNTFNNYCNICILSTADSRGHRSSTYQECL